MMLLQNLIESIGLRILLLTDEILVNCKEMVYQQKVWQKGRRNVYQSGKLSFK